MAHHKNSITKLMVVSLPAFVHLDSTQLWCLCLWNEWRKKCAQFSCNTQRIHDPPKGVRNWKVVRYTCICKVYILLVTIYYQRRLRMRGRWREIPKRQWGNFSLNWINVGHVISRLRMFIHSRINSTLFQSMKCPFK